MSALTVKTAYDNYQTRKSKRMEPEGITAYREAAKSHSTENLRDEFHNKGACVWRSAALLYVCWPPQHHGLGTQRPLAVASVGSRSPARS
jgi:hypothetical protein